MKKGQLKTAEGGREPVIMLASDGIATEHKGGMLPEIITGVPRMCRAAISFTVTAALSISTGPRIISGMLVMFSAREQVAWPILVPQPVFRRQGDRWEVADGKGWLDDPQLTVAALCSNIIVQSPKACLILPRKLKCFKTLKKHFYVLFIYSCSNNAVRIIYFYLTQQYVNICDYLM